MEPLTPAAFPGGVAALEVFSEPPLRFITAAYKVGTPTNGEQP